MQTLTLIHLSTRRFYSTYIASIIVELVTQIAQIIAADSDETIPTG